MASACSFPFSLEQAMVTSTNRAVDLNSSWGPSGVGSYLAYGRDTGVASMDMGDDGQLVPAVKGFYEGEEIRFIHTEASDPQVAGMLSDMMGSPVIIVGRLADVPPSALGDVFVFANGVRPGDDDPRGPFGFQADVFDTVPGEPGYSRLRAVTIVTWADDAEPRVLRSAREVRDAEQAGELGFARPGVVVNMPIVECGPTATADRSRPWRTTQRKDPNAKCDPDRPGQREEPNQIRRLNLRKATQLRQLVVGETPRHTRRHQPNPHSPESARR